MENVNAREVLINRSQMFDEEVGKKLSESKILFSENNSMYYTGYLNHRYICAKLDTDGQPAWDTLFTYIFPEQSGKISQPIIRNDSTVAFIRFKKGGISRFDVPLNKEIDSSGEEEILDYGFYGERDEINGSLHDSGNNVLLEWWQGGFSGTPNCQFYNLDSGLLFPETLTMESKDFMLFTALINGIKLSDNNGGFYLYSTYYCNPPKHLHDQSDYITNDGLGLLYLNPKGDFLKNDIVQVFSKNHKKEYGLRDDLKAFDRESGYWIVALNKDGEAYVQHVYNDLTFQFKDGPKQLPFSLGIDEGEMVVTPDGDFYILKNIESVDKTSSTLELYKLNDKLELLWDNPVHVFEKPIGGNLLYGRTSLHTGFAALLPRKDDGLWIIFNKDINKSGKSDSYIYINEEPERYVEVTVQLISADGERKILDKETVIAKSRYSEMLRYQWGLVDNDDGLWLFWNDFEDEIAKATYLSADGTFTKPWAKEGINVIEKPGTRLEDTGQLLLKDNSVLVSLSTKQGEFLQRLERYISLKKGSAR